MNTEFVKVRDFMGSGLLGVVVLKGSNTRVTTELDSLLESEFKCKFSTRKDNKGYSTSQFHFVIFAKGHKFMGMGVTVYKRDGILRLGGDSIGTANEFLEFLNRKFGDAVAPVELGGLY